MATLPFRSVLRRESSLFLDLAAHGYVEEEHLVDGDRWVTRILVRRPADAGSGTTILEPFHVLDEDTAMWTTSKTHLLRRRHTWVGVTVASGEWAPRGVAPCGGAARLRREDPDRYGRLHLPDHREDDELRRMGLPSTHAHEILADVARRLKEGGARRVYGAGWSQTGLVWSHYLDHGNPVDDLDAVWIAVAPGPAQLPRTTTVHLMSECELLGLLREPGRAIDDTDEPMVRGYEVPGTFHYWEQKFHRGDRTHAERHNVRPWSLLVHALLDHLERWVVNGVPLPRAPRVEGRDDVGNALGGIRSPWLDVPDARYDPRCTCSPALGSVVPIDVVARYGSLDAYRAAFRARVDELVREGWLVAEDAVGLRPPV